MLIINNYEFNYDIFIHLYNVFVVVVWLRNALHRHWAFEHLLPGGSTIREGFRGVVMSAKYIMGGGLWELNPPPISSCTLGFVLMVQDVNYQHLSCSSCHACCLLQCFPTLTASNPLESQRQAIFHLWVAWVMVFHHRDRKVTHAAFLRYSCTHPLPSFVVFMYWVWDWISLCSPIFCDWFTIYTFLKVL